MTEAPYDSEDVLQEVLAKFPDLLAGDQLPGSEPRRWISSRLRSAGEPESRDANRNVAMAIASSASTGVIRGAI